MIISQIIEISLNHLRGNGEGLKFQKSPLPKRTETEPYLRAMLKLDMQLDPRMEKDGSGLDNFISKMRPCKAKTIMRLVQTIH